MSKSYRSRLTSKLHLISPWYFLVLAVVSGVICAFALRANNQHMIGLRSDVYAADKKGTGVQQSLQALQAYVTTHMNTDLNSGNSVYPPIQLKYTYERLTKEQERQQSNSALYTRAQAYCQMLDPVDFSGHNRVPCIEQYVKTHGSKSKTTIPAELYEFSFASPAWSPDLAGWSMALAILSGLLFVVTIAGRFLIRRWN